MKLWGVIWQGRTQPQTQASQCHPGCCSAAQGVALLPCSPHCTWRAIQPGQLFRQGCRHAPSAATGRPPGPLTGTQRLPAGACGLCCTCLTGCLARALPHPTTHPDVPSARVEEHNVTTRTSAVGQVPAGPRAWGALGCSPPKPGGPATPQHGPLSPPAAAMCCRRQGGSMRAARPAARPQCLHAPR